MAKIEIRPYEPQDLAACRVLWEKLTEHHGEIYDDPSMADGDVGLGFDKHLARIGAERIWVAESAGRVCGLAGLVVQEAEAEVEPVVVLPEHRKQGIGRALLARAIEEAGKLNVPLLSARPVIRNADAISFFRTAGFTKVGHVQLFMELGETPLAAWKAGLELCGESFEY
jgi:putative acetyltransferase